MEKIERIPVTHTDIIHYFYCDGCGDYLGKSEEYDDGYYESIGKRAIHLNLPTGWFRTNKHFCNNCKEQFYRRLEKNITQLGFVEER